MPGPTVKSNYGIFAERGDAWDAPDRPARPPQTGPEGNLRMSPRAHLETLRLGTLRSGTLRSGTLRDAARSVSSRVCDSSSNAQENPDTDRYTLATRATALALRLAKERNQLSTSQTSFKPPKCGSNVQLMRKTANVRLRLTKKRAVIKSR